MGVRDFFYGKRSTFSTGFDMVHLIYQRKGGLNELSEAMCTVFQVDKNDSFHYVVHYTSKHFSLARQFSKLETNWRTHI